MRKAFLTIFLLNGLLGLAVVAAAPPTADDVGKRIGRFLEQHCQALAAQDAEAAIANLHSRGKNREKSVRDLRSQLPRMNFKYKLDAIRYIGTDGEFHYVRYTQQTLFNDEWQAMTGAAGIEMECVTILAEEDGAWKIFDTYMFSQKKLGEPSTKSSAPDK
jgi:hypothetical protein